MRALVAAILSICVFVCPKHADALDCATAGWWNFDRIDGDPQEQSRMDGVASVTQAMVDMARIPEPISSSDRGAS
jgi:hypothetical protein